MFSGIVRRSIAGLALALVLLAAFVCTPAAPLVTDSVASADYLILNFEAE
ncbi:MAG: hypothetical protein JO000_25175 [Alphaproteobacteria bacterium]|nr:hypothetical protein [Alphaproteobacteria bacterium]